MIPKTDLIWRARCMALAMHGPQAYGIGETVAVHLHDVANLVRPYGETYVATAWLHDVVEDTILTSDAIREQFSDEIADAVDLLTDPEAPSRKERKMLSHKRMAATDNKLALMVKAADRLANLRSCIENVYSPWGYRKLLKMYDGEHAVFAASVYRLFEPKEWWSEMLGILEQSRQNV